MKVQMTELILFHFPSMILFMSVYVVKLSSYDTREVLGDDWILLEINSVKIL
jgi:hypothetical protein